jgi:GTPase Era involved in 16S rRNA processing
MNSYHTPFLLLMNLLMRLFKTYHALAHETKKTYHTPSLLCVNKVEQFKYNRREGTTNLLIQQFDFLQIPQIAAGQPSGPTVWYIKIQTKINTNMEGKVGDHSTNKTLKQT